MEFNLADLFEYAVDEFADREYLVVGGRRRTYRELEERANRLAHHLAAQGVGPDDHVGIYGLNSIEWVETVWATFKLRAVWININYRYVEDELAYLFDNADLKVLLHDPEYTSRVDGVLDKLPQLTHRLIYGPEYEAALAAQSPERDFGPRSSDDTYVLFTGGTTGMPKGVVWRHEDVLFALGGGLDILTGIPIDRPEDLAAKGHSMGGMQLTFLPIAPLMHGATQWAVMGQSFTGNRVVLVPRFEPHEVWRLVQDEKVNALMITGDAMGRPLIEALEQEPSRSYDLSSLYSLSSTAAVFSPSVKDQFLERFPDLMLTDSMGASESGATGITQVRTGATAMKSGPTVSPTSGTVVLTDDGELVEPGSGVVGKVARAGWIPKGYYNDPAKTAETFVEFGGIRYVIPGDYATVEADGSITLLGRGSQSINSGGEKIYPEEVEAAVKSHPDVYDAVVVGVPDEKWGQRVAVVVELRDGVSAPVELLLESVQGHCRAKVSGYKVPRELHVVSNVVRSPSGKPDYPWAKAVATGSAPAS